MQNRDEMPMHLDNMTRTLIDGLFAPDTSGRTRSQDLETARREVAALRQAAEREDQTGPIIRLVEQLQYFKTMHGHTPEVFAISKELLWNLCEKHRRLDEHGVTVGGRIGHALPIVQAANERVDAYLKKHPLEAPSGIECWDEIVENGLRIRSILKMTDAEWQSYAGQIRHCIDTVETLARVVDLPETVITEIGRVTRQYRMRLTPYYASLVRRADANDPILLQSVPTGEMIDNAGIEIPPVAADHSPARLIDQFYPRVVTIKATNMCAMYCTHCLRIAHIGKKDRIYPEAAYAEALAYIENNSRIRDVLITGGDALVLPNRHLGRLLAALDRIDHVQVKRLGTRIPVTAPQRIDAELCDILDRSNSVKPLRLVTQINTAREITPLSQQAFKQISKCVSAVLNQAVLLKGINDTRTKMWKLCETIQESYVRPYYVFNCSYRNPQFSHFRVPIETGRDIIESMYGNIAGDAIPRYIATAGGKIPLHRSNVVEAREGEAVLRKPWNGEAVVYPDADPVEYAREQYAFNKQS